VKDWRISKMMMKILKSSTIGKQLVQIQQTAIRSFVSRSNSEEPFLKWIHQDGNGAIASSVNVRFLPEIGYDLVSTADIPQNSKIVTIPANVWKPYSADQAVKQIENEHPVLFRSILAATHQVIPSQSRETSNLIKSCCISLQFLKDVNSKNSSYSSFISAITYPWNLNANPHPLLMNPEEAIQPYLGNTKLMSDITKRQAFYKLFISKLLQEGNTLEYLVSNHFFAHSATSPDPIVQYLWAIGVVLSRGLSSATSPLSLVPFLDFSNHTNPLETNCNHRFDHESQEFQLVTSRDVRAAESLRISYGEGRSTESFMVLYGFTGINVRTSENEMNSKQLPVNPNDLFSFSIPVHIIKGKSRINAETISPEDYFQIFQSIPPLVVGDITEETILLYEHIQANVVRANASANTSAAQMCEITFPMHLLTGLSSINTWNSGASRLTVPPSYSSENQYVQQCITVIVDVILRSRKVADIVAGEGDSIAAFNIGINDVKSLQLDLQHRANLLMSPTVCKAYGLPKPLSPSTSRSELQQALRHIAISTPSPSEMPKLPPDYFWKQSCAYYMHQQLRALNILEVECARLLQQMQESLPLQKP
jgi:hypothetical protein